MPLGNFFFSKVELTELEMSENIVSELFALIVTISTTTSPDISLCSFFRHFSFSLHEHLSLSRHLGNDRHFVFPRQMFSIHSLPHVALHSSLSETLNSISLLPPSRMFSNFDSSVDRLKLGKTSRHSNNENRMKSRNKTIVFLN
jgi:hypothetical protein